MFIPIRFAHIFNSLVDDTYTHPCTVNPNMLVKLIETIFLDQTQSFRNVCKFEYVFIYVWDLDLVLLHRSKHTQKKPIQLKDEVIDTFAPEIIYSKFANIFDVGEFRRKMEY